MTVLNNIGCNFNLSRHISHDNLGVGVFATSTQIIMLLLAHASNYNLVNQV